MYTLSQHVFMISFPKMYPDIKHHFQLTDSIGKQATRVCCFTLFLNAPFTDIVNCKQFPSKQTFLKEM